MYDREKVIRGLAQISEYTRAKADIAGVGKGKEIFDSWFRAAEDAIALLREQEPVEPITQDAWPNPVKMCGSCGWYLAYTVGRPRYCPECGCEVKWDG